MNKAGIIVFFLFFNSFLYSATYVVDNTGDVDDGLVYTAADGTNSLRKCIRLANANAGADIINFNLGAAIPYTITLTAALPNLTDNSGVTIDGWENAANDGTPNSVAVFSATAGTPMNAAYAIVLANGGAGTVNTGISITGDNNIVKGLVLQNFGDLGLGYGIGINITGNSNQVLGCYVGMDVTGTTPGTKTTLGINISGGNSNIIGDGTAAGANLISGIIGSGSGIYIQGAGATSNTVKGNMIGLQDDGATQVTGDNQASGVFITASAASNTIGGNVAGEGNVISGNTNSGIYISSSAAAGNACYGNIIGPRANGTTYVTFNPQNYGIYVSDSPNNTIGSGSSHNIISANEIAGILFTGASTTGNTVKGNYIGIDKNGTTFITSSTQNNGIVITTSASSNTIGGIGAGEGNVISGNSSGGVRLNTSVGSNTVIGNIIGLQADGATIVASNVQGTGVDIDTSPDNIIGGSTAGERNIISGNDTYGVYLTDASTTGNVIKGNYIGLRSNGTTIVTSGSQDYGVYFLSNPVSNTIGGIASGEGNLISGNTNSGIYSNSASGNNMYGNIIGLQSDGATIVASNPQTNGIYLSGSPSNVIGGNTVTDVDYRNIISGNGTYGIIITGAASTSNVIKGNYIGLRSNGTAIVTSGSQDYGINVTSSAASTTIGGSSSGDGNVISGNTNSGIYLNSAAVAGNTILGNYIGSQANGTTYVASNPQSLGIYIDNSPNNSIGNGTSHNVISANETYGVYISGASSTGNTLKGNYIGLDVNGTTFITSSTQDYGIYVTTSAASNTIGGTGAGEGNLISGNANGSSSATGIYFTSAAAAGNTIIGNIIGPQADGATNVTSNQQLYGIYLQNSPNNTIGGNSSSHRNIISANLQDGIFINGASSTGNVIKGNYIGIDINGTTFIASSSQDYGIDFGTSAGTCTIGGTGAGEGNVISGNTAGGISLTMAGGNFVYGNIIGLQANGTTVLASNSQTYGIHVSSANNTIGGNTVTDVDYRNIISGNTQYGIYLTSGSSGASIKGNYIGLDINGTTLISGGSQDYGIATILSANSHTIGGTTAGDGNVISGNVA